MKFFSYGHQNITQDDINAVVEVLKSDYLTQGPALEKFEKAVCDYVGVKHAIACSNGTAALHLAVMASGLSEGDLGIAPAITFAASTNCISYCGGKVLFADVDNTVTMSVNSCKQLLEEAKQKNNPIKVLVTVDMAGNKCDYDAFSRLKEEYGFVWISDACHRIISEGGLNGPDMMVYSFHPVKHITTGEGGMIVTNSDFYAEKLRLNRSHGITKNASKFINKSEAYDKNGNVNPWYYEMQELGFNYRMTDFQAALGCSQLKKLDYSIKRRNEIAKLYKEKLNGIKNIAFPKVSVSGTHTYHLVIALIDFEAVGKTRAQIMNELKTANIGTQVHYIPVPMLPYYAKTNDLNKTPNAVSYYRKALSLPCYPELSDEDVDYICEKIKKAIIANE